MLQPVNDKRSRPATKMFLNKFDEKEGVLGEGESTWRLAELQDAFYDVVLRGQLPPLELLVDALDECGESQARRFVRFTSRLAAKAIAKEIVFNVCWSSRHYPHISTKNSFQLYVEEQNYCDIRNFVHEEISACGTLDEEFQFGEEIVKRARGVFLWATLVVRKLIKAADQGLSTAQMLSMLKKLPTELNKSLQDIFPSIDPAFRSDTLRLIQWILCAKRPLYLEELEVALAFSVSGPPPSSLEELSSSLRSWDYTPSLRNFTGSHRPIHDSEFETRSERLQRYVTAISGGLVEVVQATDNTHRPYLQVIHESVRDFLLQSHVHARLSLEPGTDFTANCSNRLFEACRRFLECPEFCHCLSPKIILGGIPLDLATGWAWMRHSFTQYASTYLLDHAAAAGVFHRDLEPGEKTALKWLYRRRLTVSRALRNEVHFADPAHVEEILTQFTTVLREAGISILDGEDQGQPYLDCYSHLLYLDPEEAVKAITEQPQSFNDFNSHIEQPFNGQFRSQYQELARCPAGNKLGAIEAHYFPLTPFSFFDLLRRVALAQHLGQTRNLKGYLKSVRLSPEILYKPAELFWAVKLDRQDMIQNLIKSRADPNATSRDMSVLAFAILLGHTRSVSMLLSMEADIRARGEAHQQPLFVAAWFGRDDILTLLLENDATLDDVCDEGWAFVLVVATEAGHYSTMELSLRHGADVQYTDGSGRTTLFDAALEKDRRATLLLVRASAVYKQGIRPLNDAELKEVEEAQKYVQEVREKSSSEYIHDGDIAFSTE
jgi:hypothetical protein